jgi:large subunit ribosomal protein L9
MKRVKVILSQDVYNLGEEGDVREVASGYARNFLIPQGLALSYNRQNVAYFEQRREAIETRKQEKREAAKGFRDRLESKVLELEMPAGDTGKLFGSVNSATIAEKLASEGITIERKKIDVPDNSIKMIGEHDVRIRLYGDEVAGIKVIVNPVGGKKVAAAGTEAQAKESTPAKKTRADKKAAAAEEKAPSGEPAAEEATATAEPAAEEPTEEAAAAGPAAEEPPEEATAAAGPAAEEPPEEAAAEQESSQEATETEEPS